MESFHAHLSILTTMIVMPKNIFLCTIFGLFLLIPEPPTKSKMILYVQFDPHFGLRNQSVLEKLRRGVAAPAWVGPMELCSCFSVAIWLA